MAEWVADRLSATRRLLLGEVVTRSRLSVLSSHKQLAACRVKLLEDAEVLNGGIRDCFAIVEARQSSVDTVVGGHHSLGIKGSDRDAGELPYLCLRSCGKHKL